MSIHVCSHRGAPACLDRNEFIKRTRERHVIPISPNSRFHRIPVSHKTSVPVQDVSVQRRLSVGLAAHIQRSYNKQ